MRQSSGWLLLAAGLLAVTLGRAPTDRLPESEEPTVHRMEIYNGAKTQVRYYAHGLNRQEQAVLRLLEQSENDPERVRVDALLWTTVGRMAGSPRLRRALTLADEASIPRSREPRRSEPRTE